MSENILSATETCPCCKVEFEVRWVDLGPGMGASSRFQHCVGSETKTLGGKFAGMREKQKDGTWKMAAPLNS